MKSSRDIPPRVGMQCSYTYAPNEGERFKIGGINPAIGCIFDAEGIHVMCKEGWRSGESFVEWTPPTDDERRLFMRRGHEVTCDWWRWYVDDSGHFGDGCDAAIAESLALDGADYDNMPDFEELER